MGRTHLDQQQSRQRSALGADRQTEDKVADRRAQAVERQDACARHPVRAGCRRRRLAGRRLLISRVLRVERLRSERLECKVIDHRRRAPIRSRLDRSVIVAVLRTDTAWTLRRGRVLYYHDRAIERRAHPD